VVTLLSEEAGSTNGERPHLRRIAPLGTSGEWANCSYVLTRIIRTPVSTLTTWHLVMVILARFQPASGIAVSYDDPKIVEAYRFIHTINWGVVGKATVEDALYAVEIIEAMAESARTGRWGETRFVNLF
jgi:hypothetical protein